MIDCYNCYRVVRSEDGEGGTMEEESIVDNMMFFLRVRALPSPRPSWTGSRRVRTWPSELVLSFPGRSFDSTGARSNEQSFRRRPIP
jgi:hypothetical protein